MQKRSPFRVIFPPLTLLAAAAPLLIAASGCVQEVQAPVMKPRHIAIPGDPNMPSYMAGSIRDRARTENNTPVTASSYGLVGQLRGTGDSTAANTVRQYMIKELSRRGFGDRRIAGFENFTPGMVLKDPNFAIVVAEADIPPGARVDDWVDVRVSALPSPNETTSLAHGVLFETDLKDAGADRYNPGEAIHTFVIAKGPILVNPAYALDAGPNPSGGARQSLRHGVVMSNGRIRQDRPVFLRLRNPEKRMARTIEARINERFQAQTDHLRSDGQPGMANAVDEGIVEVYVPRAYRGDWEHFIGVVQNLWLETGPAFNAAKAKLLVTEARKSNAPLDAISYAWEGLGVEALPFIQPLLMDPRPEIAFAAARAAAFIGDRSGVAQEALMQMAMTPSHPFRLSAVLTLGALPSSSSLNHRLRRLLDSDQALVRIEAYKVLARNGDPAVYTTPVAPTHQPNNQKFLLDVVPSNGPPLIYATRQGRPRIAVLGRTPEILTPLTFTALDDQFTMSSAGGDGVVTLYYRDASMRKMAASAAAAEEPLARFRDAPGVGLEKKDRTPAHIRPPVKIHSQPDIDKIIARLGGLGAPDDASLDFTYGEVVAVIQKLADGGQIVARDQGAVVLAAFALQEAPEVRDALNAAPVIDLADADPLAPAPSFGGGPAPSFSAEPAPSFNRESAPNISAEPAPSFGGGPAPNSASPTPRKNAPAALAPVPSFGQARQ